MGSPGQSHHQKLKQTAGSCGGRPQLELRACENEVLCMGVWIDQCQTRSASCPLHQRSDCPHQSEQPCTSSLLCCPTASSPGIASPGCRYGPASRKQALNKSNEVVPSHSTRMAVVSLHTRGSATAKTQCT